MKTSVIGHQRKLIPSELVTIRRASAADVTDFFDKLASGQYIYFDDDLPELDELEDLYDLGEELRSPNKRH